MSKETIPSVCDTCKFNKFKMDGGDGYPAIYCSKGHWSSYDGDMDMPFPGDPFADCKDWSIKLPKFTGL